jgi:tetratricopeptide (TPR) repeat protein
LNDDRKEEFTFVDAPKNGENASGSTRAGLNDSFSIKALPLDFKVLILIALVCCVAAPASPVSADHFDRGFDAAMRGQMDEAVNFWTDHLRRNPKSYETLVNRGYAYFIGGHTLKAVSDWRQARQFAPAFAYAFCPAAFMKRPNAETPMVGFAVALELDPDYVASVIMTGSLYQDIGRTQLAIELYEMSKDLTKNPLLKAQFEHWIDALKGNK